MAGRGSASVGYTGGDSRGQKGVNSLHFPLWGGRETCSFSLGREDSHCWWTGGR